MMMMMTMMTMMRKIRIRGCSLKLVISASHPDHCPVSGKDDDEDNDDVLKDGEEDNVDVVEEKHQDWDVLQSQSWLPVTMASLLFVGEVNLYIGCVCKPPKKYAFLRAV